MEPCEILKDLISLASISIEKEEELKEIISRYLLYLPIDKYCLLVNELKQIINR